MQDTLLDDQNISPTTLKAEILELRIICKTLIAKNETLISKNEEYAGMILTLREQVQLLKDEIAVLKGQKPKPKIPPNRLNGNISDPSDKDKDGKGKRPGSAKRNKTDNLEIDETRHIKRTKLYSQNSWQRWSPELAKATVVAMTY